MALLVPTVGEDKLLAFALGFAVPGDQTLKLYVNNISPADGNTAGTFTEMSTHGYAAKTLTKTSWTIAQNAGEAEGIYAQQTWTFTAAVAVTVYGYFIIDSTTGVLLWAERFATSKIVEFINDKILLTPKFTLATKP